MNGHYARLDKRSRRIVEAHRKTAGAGANAEAATFAMSNKKGGASKTPPFFSISNRPDRVACRFVPL
jgi:hypothetical protein